MAQEELLGTGPAGRTRDRSGSSIATAGGPPSGVGPALAFILLGAFMELLDVTIVTVAVPHIQSDLNSSYAQVQWVLAGFQLAFAVGLVTGGRLGDIFGRKRMYVAGVVAFIIASVLCGIAPTAGLLITARAIQGLAAALMYPQVLSIIRVGVPPEKRAAAYGILGAVIGISSVAGPLVGGALTSANWFGWSWRLIFLVNVPIGLVTVAGSLKYVRESRSPEKPKVDLVGMVLITLGLGMLLFGVIQGRDAGWSWWIWALMIGSAPVFGVFYLQQRARQSGGSPLVDLRLFDLRNGARFGTGLIVVFSLFAGISSVFLVIAIYLQAGYGFTPWHTGLAFMPIAVASMLTAGGSIPLMEKVGKYLLQLGNLILIIGTIWFMYIVHHHPTSISIMTLLPAEIVMGLGLGMVVSTNNNITLAEARGPSAGSATGIQSAVSQFGNAMGVAILGTIFFGMLGSHASAAGDQVIPTLRSQLAAQSVPSTTIDQVVTDFRHCLHDEAHASDPTVLPASCRPASMQQMPAQLSSKINPIVTEQATQATRRDFSSAMSRSLWYEVVVFGICIIVLFFLPFRRGADLTELEAR